MLPSRDQPPNTLVGERVGELLAATGYRTCSPHSYYCYYDYDYDYCSYYDYDYDYYDYSSTTTTTT